MDDEAPPNFVENNDEADEASEISRTELEEMLAGVDQPSQDARYEMMIADEHFLNSELPPSHRLKLASLNQGDNRLIITKIVNENFKSYPGRHVLGPFHKNFSCVVGPNGSGKSNVIDSLLFVFGYRAQKIRSKKLSVLIHNSSEHGKFDYCTVEVHFARVPMVSNRDEEDYENMKINIVPGSEFVVSRTVHSDSTSFYKMNGRRVQYGEIVSLLKNLGIDVEHNRFLIQQGEVEQIAMMKPISTPESSEVSLLDYLEEIIGSNRLKNIISTLETKVDELYDVKAERLTRLKFAETEKNNIEEAKDEAVLYLRIANALTRARHAAKHSKLYFMGQKIDAKSREYNECKSDLKELAKCVKENTEKLEKMNLEEKKLKAERQTLINEEKQKKNTLKNLQEAEEKQKREVTASTNRVEELKKAIVDNETEIKKLTETFEKENALNEEYKNSLKNAIDEETALKEKLEKEKKVLASETADLQKDVDVVERQLNVRKPKENSILSKISALKNKLSELTSHQKRNAAEMDSKKEELDKLTQDIPMEQKALEELETRLKRCGEELRAKQASYKVVCDLESEKGAQFRDAEANLIGLKEAYQDFKYPNETLNAVLEEARSGRIPGIIGRLGDFGSIDSKYDVAFCTACKGIDNIVVDTLETATKCVDFLKRSNKGRAAFICLDKLDRWKNEMNRRLTLPPGSQRLFDLLRVEDKKFLPAFYSSITDTLVTDNLANARRIAFHSNPRWRVATFKGEVLEKSGVMSGGGIARGGKLGARGGSVSRVKSVSKDQIAQAEQSVTAARQALQQTLANKQTIEEELEKVKMTLRQTVAERNAQRRNLDSLQSRQQTLTNDISQINTSMKSADKLLPEIQNLEGRLESLEREHQNFLKEQSSLTEQMEALQSKLKEKTDAAIGWLYSRLKDCRTLVNSENDKLRKLECNLKKIKRSLTASKEKIEQHKKEIVDNENVIKRFERNNDNFKQKIADLSERLETIAAQLPLIQPRLEQLTNDHRELREQLQTMSSELIDKTNACKALEEELDKMKSLFGKIENDIREMKLHDLSGLRPFASADGRVSFNRRSQQGDILDEVFFPSDLPDSLVVPNDEEKNNIDRQWLKEIAEELQRTYASMNVDLAAIEEFKHRTDVYMKFQSQVDRINRLYERAISRCEEVKTLRRVEFLEGFECIAAKLKQVYRTVAVGGDADLEMLDYANPFSDGITFSVRPPRKSWKQVSNLSGGEKTLSSLSFIFALHSYSPSPFYVMDEIDAALDFHNVNIIANYVRQLTLNSQFIVVSLRCEMFDKAPQLVGVYKLDNGTKILPVNVKTIEVLYRHKGIRADIYQAVLNEQRTMDIL